MKRTWILAFALATAVPIGLIGCGETEKENVTVGKSGPGGKTVESTEKKKTVTGDAGTAPAAPNPK